MGPESEVTKRTWVFLTTLLRVWMVLSIEIQKVKVQEYSIKNRLESSYTKSCQDYAMKSPS